MGNKMEAIVWTVAFVLSTVIVMIIIAHDIGFKNGAQAGFNFANCLAPSSPQHGCLAPTRELSQSLKE